MSISSPLLHALDLALLVATQGVLQQLLDMGVVGGLPEDLQWTIRMLLPKPPSCAPAFSAIRFESNDVGSPSAHIACTIERARHLLPIK